MAKVRKQKDSEEKKDPIIVHVWQTRDGFGAEKTIERAVSQLGTHLALESYRARVQRWRWW